MESRKVLVVEDEKNIRDLVCLHLGVEGYDCVPVADGKEAMLLAGEKRFDLIVLGTPMYNYGMPSTLKAWFDQVIRIGRTFSFDLKRGDWPIEPMLTGKRLVVLSARGEFGFAPGGALEQLNLLYPHRATCGRYIGVAPDAILRVSFEYQVFVD